MTLATASSREELMLCCTNVNLLKSLFLDLTLTPVVHWLALWFRNPKVAGSNPAEDGKGCELFGGQ